MKKTISILLVLTMVLSLLVAFPATSVAAAVADLTIPTISAGTDMTQWPEQPGSVAVPEFEYDKTAMGNVKVTDKAAYVAARVAEGYALVVQDDTMKTEAAGKYPDATIVTFGQMTSGTPEALAKYCLYGNLTNPATPANDYQAGEKAFGNCIIDGAGSTISINRSLFAKCVNIELKNVTLTGSISRNYGMGILMEWTSFGYTKLYNVTSDVNVTVTGNTATSQYGFIFNRSANSGSVFDNVVNTGTVTVTASTAGDYTIVSIGGFVGSATDATFTNCVNAGKVVVGSESVNTNIVFSDYAIGGFAATSRGTCKFENCANEADIVITSKTKTTSGYYTPVAGIVGAVMGGTTTFKNCVNKGDITCNGTILQDNKYIVIGGITGFSAGNMVFENCVNKGDISSTTPSPARGSAIGGIFGYNLSGNVNFTTCRNEGNISASVTSGTGFGVGGIAGFVKNTATFTNCINNGEISNAAPNNSQLGAGGMVGIKHHDGSGALTMTHCENSGKVYIGAGNAEDDMAVGGLSGAVFHTNIVVSYCKNTGTIEGYTSAAAYNPAGGLVSSMQTWGTDKSMTFNYCYNNGPVTGYVAGGILGAPGNDDGGKRVSALTLANCINDTNGKIQGGRASGGILGSNDRVASNTGGGEADIDNCVNKGAISSNDSSGGIAGLLTRSANVAACVNQGTVNCTWNPGGIVGYTKADLVVTDCTNSAAITGTRNGGGIVGKVAGGAASISDCVNTANVTSSERGGGILGVTDVGATLEDCYSDATVKGKYVGGIVGVSSGNIGITNCHSGKTENAKSIDPSTANQVEGCSGGIIGLAEAALTVKGCSNRASIKNADATNYNAKYLGGIVGRVKGTFVMGGENAADACVNYGDLIINGYYNNDHTQYVGGMVGEGIIGGTVENCKNYGDFTIGKAPANNWMAVGGIVAVPADTPDAVTFTVKNCENYGSVLSTNASKMGAAGIIGGRVFAQNTTVQVIGCTNYGNMVGRHAAGIVANVEGGAVIIKSCENRGQISGDKATPSDSIGALGGLVGYIKADCDIEDSTNEGAVIGGYERFHTGGIAGNLCGNTEKTMDNVHNNGAVSAYKHEAGTMMGIGGLVGYSQYGRLILTVCSNNNDVSLIENAAGNKGSNTYMGGLVGRLSDECAAVIEHCENNGAVDASCATATNNYAGGLVGLMQTWNPDARYESVIRFSVNNGDVSGYNAGGIFALAYPDNNKASAMTIENCANNGDITATNIAGGIFGYKTANGGHTINIKLTANSGDVKAKYAGGIIGYVDNTVTANLDTVVNIGKVEGSASVAPIVTSGNVESSTYLEGCVPEGTYLGEAEPISTVLAVFNDTFALGFTTAALDAAIEKAESIIVNEPKADYVSDTWDKMVEELADAKEFRSNELAGYTPADCLTYTDDGSYTIRYQRSINPAQEELDAAIDGLVKLDELLIFIERKLDDAEKIETAVAEGKALYTDESWGAFTAALANLRIISLSGDAMTWDVVEPAIEALDDAIEGLVSGYNIYTAEDFYRIDGLEGEFYLMADITVDKALESFCGTVYGMGHTITLDGCAISKSFSNAVLGDVKIVGDAGEADSLLGAAAEEVYVRGVVIDVPAFKVATLFTSVTGDDPDVTLYEIISYADAPLMVAGCAEDTAIDLYDVLVMAKAEGFTSIDAESDDILNSYIDGVVYYDLDGEKTTDKAVFASGVVAYRINVNFNYYALLDGYALKELHEIILVQKLDGEALPYVGKVLFDGSNLVEPDGADGYRNQGVTINLPTVNVPTEEPTELDLVALNKAIADAQALDEAKYTSQSWKALQGLLAVAKAALEAKDQTTVDIAAEALTAGIAALSEKTPEAPAAELDLSKLAAAIARAEGLKAENYSEGTWSVMQSMLVIAKSAQNSNNQDKIDQAVAALEAAIDSLKAPIAEDKPADKPDTTEPAPKEDGCGSVIGGAAVAVVAVMALGMGISFKKKED